MTFGVTPMYPTVTCKTQIPGPAPSFRFSGSEGAQECAFLTRAHVMLTELAGDHPLIEKAFLRRP